MSEANPNPAPPGTGEDEPLLGRAGDASQQDDQNIGYNLIMGMPFPLGPPSLPRPWTTTITIH